MWAGSHKLATPGLSVSNRVPAKPSSAPLDRSDVIYPLLAGTLAARRDNLVDTIAALEVRIAAINAPLFEPVAA
jgi:hypothetical protein